MEAAISAIASELINRFISFLTKKYKDMTGTDDKLERLQQLLLRIHAVVEEADGRYITNSNMLMQLKLIVESMYRGYHTLDTLKYRFLPESVQEEGSSSASTLSTTSSPMKRLRTISGMSRGVVLSHDLQNVLDNLEAVVADMSEFVVHLGGCERMCRRPYDTYLYTDNFMFGRHVEKQHIINILLQNPSHHCAPLVLPIIGRYKVGKKTLVSHVCNEERVRSRFSSILYMNGETICRVEQAQFSEDNTLVIVEFASDVDDEDWVKFYSSVTRLGGSRSKVIVISRLQNVARVGTTKPIYLNSLSQEEFSYLFKMLAFGSTDARETPQLASIADKIAIALRGLLLPANVLADLLRRNHDIQFWLRILQRFKGMLATHLAEFGEHPRNTLEKEHPLHIIGFTSSSCPFPLRLMPPRVGRDDDPLRKLPHVMFGDLIAGVTAIPCEFVVSWDSRIPPYTKFVHSVEVRTEEKHDCTTPTGKRRSRN